VRTHTNLYSRIVAFPNLLHAARLAQRGKRFKSSTARFNFFLEYELWRLHRALAAKKYRPGKYQHFRIYEPKERIISAAPYRDRVVHHAVHNILEPLFEPTFIFDSYATRKGKGTHAAIDRFQHCARAMPYVLKCDIQQYFPSIDHDILMQLLRRKIACTDTLELIATILASHRTMAPALQPTDRPTDRIIGIPIGNLTSQFFANVYLTAFDHFVQERLGCRYYVRYMDDFVIFEKDKQRLWKIKAEIVQYLQSLRLRLHEGKCRIFRVAHGVPFLGLVVFPRRRRLQRANVVRARRRLHRLQKLDRHGVVSWSHVIGSIRAWIGHAQHADTMQLRTLLLGDIVFQRKGDAS